MVFTVVFRQARLLRALAEALSDLVVDFNIDVLESGFNIQCMDVGHVCLVDMSLACSDDAMFGSYDVTTPATLGVNLPSLLRVLRCASAGDEAALSLAAPGDNALSITFSPPASPQNEGADEGNRYVGAFKLNLIEITSDHLVVERDLDATLRVPSSVFARSVRDLAGFADTVRLKAARGRLELSGRGDIGSASLMIPAEGPEGDGAQPCIAARYLVSLSKAAPLSEHVLVKISEGSPFALHVQLGEGASGSFASFYVAPKIDEDDEAPTDAAPIDEA